MTAPTTPNDGMTDRYGLVRVGGARLALPLSALREVVPMPTEVHRLPVTARGLVGAMNLRTAVVPLLDLRAWVGGDEQSPTDVVVLVAAGGRLVGLVGDGVDSIVRIGADDGQTLSAAGEQLIVRRAVQHPVTGDLLTIVDVDRLLSLPGVPVAQDVTRASAAGAATAGERERRRMTLLSIDGHVVALDVQHVHTMLPPSPPVPSLLTGGHCIGVAHHRGLEVPIIDLVSLLGLGRASEDAWGPRAVLSLPAGLVLLQLADVLSIVEVDDDDVLPIPSGLLRRHDLVTGMLVVDGVGQVLVLDGDAIATLDEVRTLAVLNTSVGGERVDTSRHAGAGGATDDEPGDDPRRATATADQHLLLRAGTRMAVPLEQVDEILPWPDRLLDTAVGGIVHGAVVHRDATLPVLSLARLLGRPEPPHTLRTCIVVVRVDGRPTGFVVEQLERIDRLTWAEPQPEGATPGADRLVTLGDDTTLLSAVDLQALASIALDSTAA